MHTYRLINYFDVLGNEKEGYFVNNQCVEANDLHISDDSTNKEIAEFLVQIGFLVTSDMRRLSFCGTGEEIIEIYQKKRMYPLGALEMIS